MKSDSHWSRSPSCSAKTCFNPHRENKSNVFGIRRNYIRIDNRNINLISVVVDYINYIFTILYMVSIIAIVILVQSSFGACILVLWALSDFIHKLQSCAGCAAGIICGFSSREHSVWHSCFDPDCMAEDRPEFAGNLFGGDLGCSRMPWWQLTTLAICAMLKATKKHWKLWGLCTKACKPSARLFLKQSSLNSVWTARQIKF